MPTRVLRFAVSVGAGATDVKIGEDTPIEGFTWRLVEIRPFFTGDGIMKVKRGAEVYKEIDYNCWSQDKSPLVVDLQFAAGQRLSFWGSDLSAAPNPMRVNAVVEETPV